MPGATFPWVMTGFSGTAEQVDELRLDNRIWCRLLASTEFVSSFVDGVTSWEFLLCHLPSGTIGV